MNLNTIIYATGTSETDEFSKKLKMEKKNIQVQKQTMAAKLKLAKRMKRLKRFNQELGVLLLIITCFVDLVKYIPFTSAQILFQVISTAIVLLITCVGMM